ncbi:MAG: SAM-dependent DNA methyltransferase [Candidatus Eremiobacteraeota bacterium]|nr:SAM-dependent DNA methyltransferase [Candidatus Eremiobacteraeota bacterium]MBV9972289.1 SAM-dependent DNA methyltransferase [Candidatus Eremiobacteraeota bacterium]
MRDDFATKLIGAYYTPDWLAGAVANWTLKPSTITVLDPSFGGCAFLRAALNKKNAYPLSPDGIFGVDIDTAALKHAEHLFARGVPRRNIRIANFLEAKVCSQYVERFDAVLGNPPFVRHHLCSDEAIGKAQDAVHQLGIQISRRASTWAYFTLLAADSVRCGGRLGLILPEALLQASYATPVVEYLASHFEPLRLIRLQERIFDKTPERCIIVLGIKRTRPKRSISVEYAKTQSEAVVAIRRSGRATLSVQSVVPYNALILPETVLDAYRRVQHAASGEALGDVARIRIGLVTGANAFFIRQSSDALFKSRLVSSYPILPKKIPLRDILVFDKEALRQVATQRTCLAVIRGLRSQVAKGEILRGHSQGLHLRTKCAQRVPWYRLTDLDVPDAFLPYMNASAPTLTKNAAGALCTNAIHRVFIKNRSHVNAIVSSSYTALFAFQCEIYGRNYGGGVLKIEPSAALQLAVSSSMDILNVLRHSDPAVRDGIADNAFAQHWGIPTADMEALRYGATLLEKARRLNRVPRSRLKA